MKKLLIILFVLCLCVSAFGQFIPIKMFGQQLSGPFADGLVGFWRFIEAGNLVDESFGRNHGTITGATWVGQGLDFSAATDEVNFGTDSLNITTTCSFVVDIKIDTFTDFDAVFSRSVFRYPVRGYVTANRRFVVDFGTTGGTAGIGTGINIIPVGIWTHVVVTANATLGTINIYVNGINKASSSGLPVGTFRFNAESWTIGRPSNDVWDALDGQVKGFSIYNRALSASEIQQLYINPDLPIEQEPIWLLRPPPAAEGGQVILITKAEDEWPLPMLWACIYDDRYWWN